MKNQDLSYISIYNNSLIADVIMVLILDSGYLVCMKAINILPRLISLKARVKPFLSRSNEVCRRKTLTEMVLVLQVLAIRRR